MTDMQTFISRCHDTLTPIAELMLDDVSQLIEQLLEENLPVYLSMESLLSDPSQQTPQVNVQSIIPVKNIWTGQSKIQFFSSFI